VNDSASIAPPHVLRVLVVDDSVTNRRLLLHCEFVSSWHQNSLRSGLVSIIHSIPDLRRNGHICDEAIDGVDAVERVAKSMERGEYYDSILMDFEMPRLNGQVWFDFCSWKLIRVLTCLLYRLIDPKRPKLYVRLVVIRLL